MKILRNADAVAHTAATKNDDVENSLPAILASARQCGNSMRKLNVQVSSQSSSLAYYIIMYVDFLHMFPLAIIFVGLFVVATTCFFCFVHICFNTQT